MAAIILRLPLSALNDGSKELYISHSHHHTAFRNESTPAQRQSVRKL